MSTGSSRPWVRAVPSNEGPRASVLGRDILGREATAWSQEHGLALPSPAGPSTFSPSQCPRITGLGLVAAPESYSQGPVARALLGSGANSCAPWHESPSIPRTPLENKGAGSDD